MYKNVSYLLTKPYRYICFILECEVNRDCADGMVCNSGRCEGKGINLHKTKYHIVIRLFLLAC